MPQEAGGRPLRIFISYRRSDSSAHAGRLYDSLEQLLRQAAELFIDIDAIPVGVHWRRHIADAIAQCDVALVLIGPGWLRAGENGARRLHDPEDMVRFELTTALAGGLLVVPVCVGGATLPTADELPEDLRPLLDRNGKTLDDVRWRGDVRGLVDDLVAHHKRLADLDTHAAPAAAGPAPSAKIGDSPGSPSAEPSKQPTPSMKPNPTAAAEESPPPVPAARTTPVDVEPPSGLSPIAPTHAAEHPLGRPDVGPRREARDAVTAPIQPEPTPGPDTTPATQATEAAPTESATRYVESGAPETQRTQRNRAGKWLGLTAAVMLVAIALAVFTFYSRQSDTIAHGGAHVVAGGKDQNAEAEPVTCTEDNEGTYTYFHIIIGDKNAPIFSLLLNDKNDPDGFISGGLNTRLGEDMYVQDITSDKKTGNTYTLSGRAYKRPPFDTLNPVEFDVTVTCPGKA